MTPFELAAAQGVPVYMLVAAWDAQTLRPALSIRALTADTPLARLAELVASYESLIRARPGAWHLWGEWPLFFEPSKA